MPPIPDVSSIQIPQDVVTSIQNLKVPTLDDVEKALGKVISAPFQVAEQGIKDKFGNITAEFNATFNLPMKSTSPPVSFCRDKFDTTWVDKVADKVALALYISIAIMLVLALCITLLNAFFIKRQHDKHERNVASLVASMQSQSQEYDLQARSMIQQASSPGFFAFSLKSSSIFPSKLAQHKWRW